MSKSDEAKKSVESFAKAAEKVRKEQKKLLNDSQKTLRIFKRDWELYSKYIQKYFDLPKKSLESLRDMFDRLDKKIVQSSEQLARLRGEFKKFSNNADSKIKLTDEGDIERFESILDTVNSIFNTAQTISDLDMGRKNLPGFKALLHLADELHGVLGDSFESELIDYSSLQSFLTNVNTAFSKTQSEFSGFNVDLNFDLKSLEEAQTAFSRLDTYVDLISRKTTIDFSDIDLSSLEDKMSDSATEGTSALLDKLLELQNVDLVDLMGARELQQYLDSTKGVIESYFDAALQLGKTDFASDLSKELKTAKEFYADFLQDITSVYSLAKKNKWTQAEINKELQARMATSEANLGMVQDRTKYLREQLDLETEISRVSEDSSEKMHIKDFFMGSMKGTKNLFSSLLELDTRSAIQQVDTFSKTLYTQFEARARANAGKAEALSKERGGEKAGDSISALNTMTQSLAMMSAKFQSAIAMVGRFLMAHKVAIGVTLGAVGAVLSSLYAVIKATNAFADRVNDLSRIGALDFFDLENAEEGLSYVDRAKKEMLDFNRLVSRASAGSGFIDRDEVKGILKSFSEQGMMLKELGNLSASSSLGSRDTILGSVGRDIGVLSDRLGKTVEQVTSQFAPVIAKTRMPLEALSYTMGNLTKNMEESNIDFNSFIDTVVSATDALGDHGSQILILGDLLFKMANTQVLSMDKVLESYKGIINSTKDLSTEQAMTIKSLLAPEDIKDILVTQIGELEGQLSSLGEDPDNKGAPLRYEITALERVLDKVEKGTADPEMMAEVMRSNPLYAMQSLVNVMRETPQILEDHLKTGRATSMSQSLESVMGSVDPFINAFIGQLTSSKAISFFKDRDIRDGNYQHASMGDIVEFLTSNLEQTALASEEDLQSLRDKEDDLIAKQSKGIKNALKGFFESLLIQLITIGKHVGNVIIPLLAKVVDFFTFGSKGSDYVTRQKGQDDLNKLIQDFASRGDSLGAVIEHDDKSIDPKSVRARQDRAMALLETAERAGYSIDNSLKQLGFDPNNPDNDMLFMSRLKADAEEKKMPASVNITDNTTTTVYQWDPQSEVVKSPSYGANPSLIHRAGYLL